MILVLMLLLPFGVSGEFGEQLEWTKTKLFGKDQDRSNG